MPPPSSSRSVQAEGRYTVVYEGDPGDVNILAGEPAPGRAVGVGLGDLAELYDREDRRVAAEIAVLGASLREVRDWISNWSPNFEQDEEWPAVRRRMDAAIALAEGRPASSGEA